MMAETTMNPTRRELIAAAPSLAAVRAPSDRIRIGLIGAGGRAGDHFAELTKKDLNARITHVCDVWRPAREKFAAQVKQAWGAEPKTCTRYQDLLADKDVDAVILTAPDHTHSRMLADAVVAGKDVYCEKPMGTILSEARDAFIAVKRSKQVVQIGTQRRSDPGLIAAAKALRAGAIGKITRADIQYHFQEPRWRRDFHMIKAEDIDWQAFSFGRDLGPFDARKFREWQLFPPLTNGIAGLWLSHFIDLAYWFLDDPYPSSVVSHGGVYMWNDGRVTSDVFHTLVEYPKGCMVHFAMSMTNTAGSRHLWFGSKGTLNAETLTLSPEGSKDPQRLQGEIKLEPVKVNTHLEDFLDCVRTRETPRADIQCGFSHAVAVIMSSEALRLGRKTTFDTGKLEIA
jgi:predicted dehydrogenase